MSKGYDPRKGKAHIKWCHPRYPENGYGWGHGFRRMFGLGRNNKWEFRRNWLSPGDY